MTSAENSAGKQRGRPFPKGKSGNPSGKPKGCRNHATRLAERLLEGEAEAIIRKAIELAKQGDSVAMRLCLERILPPAKGRPVALDLPKVDTAADVFAALGAVVQAMAGGTVTPEEAAIIAGVLEAKRKAIETLELEKRLAALEQKAGIQ